MYDIIYLTPSTSDSYSGRCVSHQRFFMYLRRSSTLQPFHCNVLRGSLKGSLAREGEKWLIIDMFKNNSPSLVSCDSTLVIPQS